MSTFQLQTAKQCFLPCCGALKILLGFYFWQLVSIKVSKNIWMLWLLNEAFHRICIAVLRGCACPVFYRPAEQQRWGKLLKSTWQAGGRTGTIAWKCLLLFCLLRSQTRLTRVNVMREGAREKESTRTSLLLSHLCMPTRALTSPTPSPLQGGRFSKDQGEMWTRYLSLREVRLRVWTWGRGILDFFQGWSSCFGMCCPGFCRANSDSALSLIRGSAWNFFRSHPFSWGHWGHPAHWAKSLWMLQSSSSGPAQGTLQPAEAVWLCWHRFMALKDLASYFVCHTHSTALPYFHHHHQDFV